jgi:hypothetical protein
MMTVDATRTPSAEHLEFDRLCEQVEDFGYLPTTPLENETAAQTEHDDEAELDQRILVGLVSPV